VLATSRPAHNPQPSYGGAGVGECDRFPGGLGSYIQNCCAKEGSLGVTSRPTTLTTSCRVREFTIPDTSRPATRTVSLANSGEHLEG
jgi:hypothetical protein